MVNIVFVSNELKLNTFARFKILSDLNITRHITTVTEQKKQFLQRQNEKKKAQSKTFTGKWEKTFQNRKKEEKIVRTQIHKNPKINKTAATFRERESVE